MFLRNLSITGLSSIVTQSCNMFFWLAFAKILSPSDFGGLSLIIGTALLFVILNELLISVIIQKLHSSLTSYQFDSIITFSVFISLVFYILFSTLAFIFNWGGAMLLFIGLFTCVFGVVQSIYKSDIEAKLNFKFLAKIEFFSALLSVISILVILWFGVKPLLAASFYFFIIYIFKFLFYRKKVQPFNTEFREIDIKWVLKTIVSFKELVSFMTVNAYVRNADNYLVVLNYGLSALGVYSFAYKVMLAPVTKVSGIVAKVLFPTLNKAPILNGQFEILTVLFKIVFLLSIILMSFILFIQDELANYFGFSNSIDFKSVLFWLCFSGVFQSVTSLLHVILVSAGNGNKLKSISINYFILYSLVFLSSFVLSLKNFCFLYFIATFLYFSYYMMVVYKSYLLSFFNKDFFFYLACIVFFISTSAFYYKYKYTLFSLSLLCSITLVLYYLLLFKKKCKIFDF